MRPSIDHAIRRFRTDPPDEAFALGELSIVEVGVQEGVHAAEVYDELKPKKMFLVDPYYAYPGVNGIYYTKEVMTEYMNTAKKAMSSRPSANFLHLTSIQASRTFNNNTFDIVYIDADHTYDCVAKDIEYWWPKVKPGGALCGHDYDCRGLVLAVNEAARRLGLQRGENFFEFNDMGCPEWLFIKKRG